MTISDRIFNILNQKKMSEEVFAESTGIPKSVINEWHNKNINPDADKILIICEVLDVSPYYLLSGQEKEDINRAKQSQKIYSNPNNITITQLNADEGKENKTCKYKMFLTDCDGCLTDGGMYYSERGDELKKFNTKDGMGFGILRELGIITGVITGENVDLNRRRCEKLRLDILAPGCLDKVSKVKELCARYNVDLSEVVYIGDDINDREVIKLVGYGCCPNDAHSKVKKIADYVTEAKGGEGVIREVVDKILS